MEEPKSPGEMQSSKKPDFTGWITKRIPIKRCELTECPNPLVGEGTTITIIFDGRIFDIKVCDEHRDVMKDTKSTGPFIFTPSFTINRKT